MTDENDKQGQALRTDACGRKMLFQHPMLCRRHLPYHDVGMHDWTLRAGFFSLQIIAGNSSKDCIDAGVPYGSVARLLLYYLNTEAVQTQSPLIDLESSLPDFVHPVRSCSVGGWSSRDAYHQLVRLAAAQFSFGPGGEDTKVKFQGPIIKSVEPWNPESRRRGSRQTKVELSPFYFDGLMQQPVPLHEGAILCIADDAVVLDIYTWLAERLPRVGKHDPALVPWAFLMERFGDGYTYATHFKSAFTEMLYYIEAIYPAARFHLDAEGMHLAHSEPPGAQRLHAVPVH